MFMLVPTLSTLPCSQGQPRWSKGPAALSLQHPLDGSWLGLTLILSVTGAVLCSGPRGGVCAAGCTHQEIDLESMKELNAKHV